jgi:hypothetical protein
MRPAVSTKSLGRGADPFQLVISNVLGNNNDVLSRSYDDGWASLPNLDNPCMRFVLGSGSARAASRLAESAGSFHRK